MHKIAKNKDTPLVSVIMNCYNGDKFLKKAIDSVYSQSYKNWEIVFLDNASTDSSSDIALSYDDRLKYYKLEQTVNLGEARVEATNLAIGEYIAFLDCDDLWCRDKIYRQVETIHGTNSGLVYCSTNIIDENGVVTGNTKKDIQSGFIFPSLTKKNFIPFVSVLMPIKVYKRCGGFPSHYKNSTDYHLFLKVSKKYNITAIEDTLCSYRVHSNNLSCSQRISSAKESIDSVSWFLPDTDAINGLRYQYADLALAYLRERKIINFIVVIFTNRIFVIVFKTILSKIINAKKNKY